MQQQQQQSHYQVLGVPATAPAADIKRAYRRLATQLHPDKHGGDHRYAEQFKAVAVAYGVLSDPGRRAQYDLQLQVAARRAADAQRMAAAAPRPAPDPAYRGAQAPAAARPLRTRPPAGSRERHYQPRASRQQVRFNRQDFWLVAGLAALILLFGISATVVLTRVTAGRRLQEARAALARRQWPQARQLLGEVLDLRPDHGEALRLRGQLAQDVDHNYRAAQLDYEAALLADGPALPPADTAPLLLRLAATQEARQRPRTAETTLARALAADSTLTAALLARARLRLEDLRRPLPALADLRLAQHQLVRRGRHLPPDALQRRGAALASIGRYGEAQAAYLDALRQQPDNGRTLFLLGRLAQQAGDSAHACAYFQRGAAVGYGYAMDAAARCRR